MLLQSSDIGAEILEKRLLFAFDSINLCYRCFIKIAFVDKLQKIPTMKPKKKKKKWLRKHKASALENRKKNTANLFRQNQLFIRITTHCQKAIEKNKFKKTEKNKWVDTQKLCIQWIAPQFILVLIAFCYTTISYNSNNNHKNNGENNLK